MFDFVRKHTKIVMFLLFLLIIPSFVFFGIEGYTRSTEKSQVVATVGGKDITQAQWDAAHASEIDRIRAQNPTVDIKLLDSAEARYATLERLVRDQALVAAAARDHIVASDARLARALQEDPAIAALRGADGKLDVERYRQLLASQGFTPAGFEARVRGDLASRQVLLGVQGSAFTPPAQADAALNPFFEGRQVQVANFLATAYRSKVTVADADIEREYQAQSASFRTPERARIEYVLLDLDAVKQSMVVNEQELKDYYQQNLARMASGEERQARHILFTAAKDAPASARAKAKADAEAALAEVRKSPAAFADVARKRSQDPGSAANGGDLGFFARGAMVKPFEDAVFALEKGGISDVVESDFGYHVIQLTDIKAAKTRSFDEMRGELEAQLKQQQAQRKFAEAAETFTNAVYEQADALKPVADKLKLPVKTAEVLRQPGPQQTGPLANAKLLAAVFAPDAVEKKRNTDAIEVGQNQLVAARVVEHMPARLRPLEEVRDTIRDTLIGRRAAELAREEGQAKLAAWKAAPQTADAALGAPVQLSRENPGRLPQALVDAALRAPAATLPAWTGADLGEAGYAVVRINKLVPREAPAEAVARDRGQYVQWWSSAETQAYYAWLKENLKVRIMAPRPAPAAAG